MGNTPRERPAAFVHLHVHSQYSLREGAARVEDLARRAGEMGMEALALTDHDGMYGAVRFTLACRQAGVRPILGAELEWDEGYHVVLLAENAAGWANLCRLVTGMHLGARAQSLPPGRRPRTSFGAIARYSAGLAALSGCRRGEVPWLVSANRMKEAEAAARRWLEVFGRERFAIELSNHLLEDDSLRNRRLLELARGLGIRTVATNNVHYVERSDWVVHEVLDCIRRIAALSPATAARGNSELWLKDASEMSSLHPPEAVAGSEWLAERCGYQLPLGRFHFPDPPSRGGSDAFGTASSTEVLARRAQEGLRRRYPTMSAEIDERLQKELRLIRRSGFCGYFLVVADIVDHAKRVLGIRCACRGSAAGSLVAYALGISEVDPIRHDLVFERFMNEHRREIPDIDLDFESARREEVNAHILKTYPGRCAMVSMMETFRARGALRAVGKALGLPESEIDALARAFPHIPAAAIPRALDTLPELAGMGLGAARLETLFDLAARLDGYPRHLALHPSAIILSDIALADLMPMQRSYGGFLMSQFDKDDVEALGIAKLDVLGVRMLSAMAHTLDEIERVRGVRPDLEAIPPDDPATFDLIRNSATLGCFQIESPGQRELLGKFQPDRFEDLIIDISLFRPGPVRSDMVTPFLERRMGMAPVTYPHPSLRPILAETHGVIVYHEQVIRVIAALTGADLAEADRIRRLLDDDAATEGIARELIERAVERGWDAGSAGKACGEVLAFASFGFCKAHAAAFAVLTYRSAWLKAHYPAEFYGGVLSHEPGMYPRRAILAEARRRAIPILPVDVNRSFPDYRVERIGSSSTVGLGIRLGLKDVGGASPAEIERIVSCRPWRSFEDFCRRARVSRPLIEALVHCGAFDRLKGKRSRRELWWMLREVWSGQERSGAGQLSLDLRPAEQVQLPGIDDYSPRERVEAELEILGLDASRHILSFYREELEALGWVPAAELRALRARARVVVAGVKVATQTPPLRGGKQVIFLTLEDGTGHAEVVLFDPARARYARRVFDGWILAVRGTLRRTGAGGVSVLGEEVIDIAGVPDRSGSGLWHASRGSAG